MAVSRHEIELELILSSQCTFLQHSRNLSCVVMWWNMKVELVRIFAGSEMCRGQNSGTTVCEMVIVRKQLHSLSKLIPAYDMTQSEFPFTLPWWWCENPELASVRPQWWKKMFDSEIIHCFHFQVHQVSDSSFSGGKFITKFLEYFFICSFLMCLLLKNSQTETGFWFLASSQRNEKALKYFTCCSCCANWANNRSVSLLIV